MTSLLDPKIEEEGPEEPEEKWYAVIIYDDASGIWHLTEHLTRDDAMDKLRELVFDSMGGNDERRLEEEDDDYWRDLIGNYMNWTLDDMNERLEGSSGVTNTVFCRKGGTEH